MHQGLLNATGTRSASNGALYGSGIYASTHMHTAFAFTSPAPAWRNSAFGRRLRCMLLCRISHRAALDLAHRRSEAGDGLPGTYLVIPNPGDIEIRYVMIWSEDGVVGTSEAAGWRGASTGGGGGRGIGRGDGMGGAGDDGSGGSDGGVGTAQAAAGGRRARRPFQRLRQQRWNGSDVCMVLAIAYVAGMLLLAVVRNWWPHR